MNSFDLIRLATINFLRSKIRSFLTILGVVIGTASIVVMLSIGIGQNESFKQQVSQMGSLTTIDVYPGGNGGMYGNSTGGSTAKLDDRAIQTISTMKGVKVATPLVQTSAKLVAGKYIAWLNLIGIRPEALEKLGYQVSAGRLLTETDTDSLLFGFGITNNFYNPKARGYQQPPKIDLMTEKLQLTFDTMYGENVGNSENPGQEEKQPAKLYKIKASGILAESRNERDWSVYMNLEHLNKLIRENAKVQKNQGMNNSTQQGYQRAIVQVTDMKYVEPVRDEIKTLGFSTSALTDVLKGLQQQSKMMQTLLGSIGAISLLVAAIGIANTMIMSIYERTREIGIMKVLGCELKDIRRLFLLEAGFIGFLGGVMGVLFSIGASYLLNKFGGSLFGSMGGGMYDPSGAPLKSSIIPTWLMGSAIVFATLVGLISGFYPARRAMKLSALEAIKTE
ncbi:ABC transporter permease [Gorillibacterium timonense]|uniref:ABC transporter permease n=1 Tax=Gorillibacterium timonense TaxID=1689269 RepID=UPI00071E4AFC|nr:FtsX-like permease family protein [Gorillibacterium timonense]